MPFKYDGRSTALAATVIAVVGVLVMFVATMSYVSVRGGHLDRRKQSDRPPPMPQ